MLGSGDSQALPELGDTAAAMQGFQCDVHDAKPVVGAGRVREIPEPPFDHSGVSAPGQRGGVEDFAADHAAGGNAVPLADHIIAGPGCPRLAAERGKPGH
jgi:hypothetical protein